MTKKSRGDRSHSPVLVVPPISFSSDFTRKWNIGGSKDIKKRGLQLPLEGGRPIFKPDHGRPYEGHSGIFTARRQHKDNLVFWKLDFHFFFPLKEVAFLFIALYMFDGGFVSLEHCDGAPDGSDRRMGRRGRNIFIGSGRSTGFEILMGAEIEFFKFLYSLN